MIGLLGSHRSGKTTLAKAYALKSGSEFLATSLTEFHRAAGFDVTAENPFSVRLAHQEKVLDFTDAMYAKHACRDVIADRTPLDMIAYTMAEAFAGRVRGDDQARFAAYVQRCFDVTNKRFGTLMLIQPGISFVEEEGKAANNPAYIEHLNTILLGLIGDPRLLTSHWFIPRTYTDIADRIRCLENAVSRATVRSMQIIEDELGQGALLH